MFHVVLLSYGVYMTYNFVCILDIGQENKKFLWFFGELAEIGEPYL